MKPLQPLLRKFLLLLMVLGLSFTSLACGSSTLEAPNQNVNSSSPQASRPLPDGQYTVQQATYNDADGEYTLFLLDTPPGTPATLRTPDLQMAQLTEAETNAGQKSYLKVDQGKASLHIPEDFRIEYIHNVTQTQTDPQTGQPQTVVVRQEPSFWTPFAGALAGQAIGNLLFTPRYYVPPVYQSGRPLTGYGGYGSTYGQAINRYQSRYQSPPAAVRNRQTLRTTGRLRSPTTTTRRAPSSSNRNRATGSGYGSSNLRRSNRPTYNRSRPRSGSFGSGGGRRSFSGGGRRR
jgi:hypothetical protein